MSASSGWLEDVAVGALAGGVNTPTSVLLKLVVALLLIPESALLAVAVRKGFAVGHCIAIIVLTLVLLGLLVWFLSEVGVVSAEDQRKELGLTTPAEEASPSATTDTAPDVKKTD